MTWRQDNEPWNLLWPFLAPKPSTSFVLPRSLSISSCGKPKQPKENKYMIDKNTVMEPGDNVSWLYLILITGRGVIMHTVWGSPAWSTHGIMGGHSCCQWNLAEPVCGDSVLGMYRGISSGWSHMRPLTDDSIKLTDAKEEQGRSVPRLLLQGGVRQPCPSVEWHQS